MNDSYYTQQELEGILKQYLSDDIINQYWFGNFGPNPDRREIIRQGLASRTADFHTGATVTDLLQYYGLIGEQGRPTKKGRKYLYFANMYAIKMARQEKIIDNIGTT